MNGIKACFSVFCLIFIISTCTSENPILSLTPSEPLSNDDKQRLSTVFESALSSRNPEPHIWHYSLLGYHLLQLNDFPKPEAACQLFAQAIVQTNQEPLTKTSIETLYHALDGAALVKGGCSKTSTWPTKAILDSIVKNVQQFFKSEADSESAEIIYYIVSSLKNLGSPADASFVSGLLDKVLQKDTSAAVQLYVFQTAVLANLPKTKLKRHFDDIEDVIQQADEADGRYVYFESGLFTTAGMVNAIYQLAEKYGEMPKIPEEKLLKLSNFLLSRRYTYQPRAAAYLTLALRTLSENKRIVPICLGLSGKTSISAGVKEASTLFVSLTDVWGKPLDNPLKANSVKNLATNTVHSKAVIELKKDSKSSLYALDLSSLTLHHGYYTVQISGSANHQGVIFVGIANNPTIQFKVTTENVVVGPVHFASEEADGSSNDGGSTSALQQITLNRAPDSLKTLLNIDSHIKLRVSIHIGANEEAFRPHQCFFRLRHLDSGREIFLIPDVNSKVDAGKGKIALQIVVDPSTQAKDFDYLSGKYGIEFIVNDALMTAGVRWQLGDINLVLPAAPTPPPTSPSPLVHWADAPRLPGQNPKHEIHHLFRVPDQRASKFIALTFTVLCGLPLIILLGLWAKLGVNIRGISDNSLAAVGFHVCLAGIFVLYYFYWTRWDMFTTLGLIFILGIPTFLFGNRMLRSIASQRLQGKKIAQE